MTPESEMIERAVKRVRDAAEKYKPIAVVGLISGGHDSLTANIIAQEACANFSLHINTGIGVPQTRDFVYDTCAREGWELREYKALDHIDAKGAHEPQDYEAIVRAHGFPGPFMHRKMYNQLKERQLRQFEREIGATPKAPVLYVSGMRTDESSRRMGNMKRDQEMGVHKEGRRAWVAPIHDFTKKDCGSCMKACGVSRSPVVDLLHKSGECLCGAFAKRGELDEIALWYPEVAKRIRDLEREVADKFPWKWEDPGPPQWWRESQQGQGFMEFHAMDGEAPKNEPLCHRCNVANPQ